MPKEPTNFIKDDIAINTDKHGITTLEIQNHGYDREITEEFVTQFFTNQLIIDGLRQTLQIFDTYEIQVFLEKARQDQKDAQEYREIMSKVAEYHEEKQKEFAQVITPIIIKNRELQSQHKKLVDAIQKKKNELNERINLFHTQIGKTINPILIQEYEMEIARILPLFDQLQNLLKESEN